MPKERYDSDVIKRVCTVECLAEGYERFNND